MSRETWLLMVKVARRKLAQKLWQPIAQRPRKKRACVREQLRTVREDHYMMLLAAQY